MEYLALYRKYRPSNFTDMVGQDEIKTILSSSVINNTISHAYLFSGPRGTGKTSTAKIFAKLVNCENPVDGNPCNKCENCKLFADSSDIIEIDAASNNGVDEIRDLREKANLVPSFLKYKVYIIDEVHMLTTQAFNALLKTLEEPPRHVIFILATTEYHKVPLTISSRCQKFQFNKLSIDDNYKKLKEIADNEKITITDDALYEIAKISDGGMRDSINYLDQIRSFKVDNIDISDVFEVCGNVSYDEILNLLSDIRNQNAFGISSYLEDIDSKGKSYSKFLEDILYFLKETILIKNDISYKNVKINVDLLKQCSSLFSSDDIFYICNCLDKLMEKLRYSSRQSILVVTSFLLIMNRFNLNNNDSININSDNMKLNFKDKIDSDSVNQSTENLQLSKDTENINSNNNSDNYFLINKDIIINNALSSASKKIKSDLQNKFDKISDYLLEKKYKAIASLLVDCKIAVAGNDYVVFYTSLDSIIDNIYSKNDILTDLINKLFGKDYYYAFISNDDWDKYKAEYVKCVKNGKSYSMKNLIDNNLNNSSDSSLKNESFVDKLVNIVGDDIIEYK